MIESFPKIYAVGNKFVNDIFRNDVYITEKVDGSQFAFGMIGGNLFYRSKGRNIPILSIDQSDMFWDATQIAHKLHANNQLPEGVVVYGEYLRKPKHNVLGYSRIPKNHIAIYAAKNLVEDFWYKREALEDLASKLDLDIVPLLFHGKLQSSDDLLDLINNESFLGGTHMEGCVVSDLTRDFFVADRYHPIMCAKFVSERFKEVHSNSWKGEHTTGGVWESYKEHYRTEARWEKAVQRLREAGTLLVDPRDIGSLIKSTHKDIEEECKEDIKEFLWQTFGKDLLRGSTRGLPEWYKEKLLKEAEYG